MSETETTTTPRLMTETVDIVTAYVAKNAISKGELPELIVSVHAALCGLGGTVVEQPGAAVEQPTASQIRKSITPDALISFVDGKPYKTLRRHLAKHGLKPEGYRVLYGLPADYPMTSANYSAQRSALAKTLGLGQQGRQAARQAA